MPKKAFYHFAHIMLFITATKVVANNELAQNEEDLFSDSTCQWHKPSAPKMPEPGKVFTTASSLPELENTPIKKITLIRKNIFDTTQEKENNLFFRAANRLNVLTKEEVILQQLLFKEGDIYNRQLVIESMRILRNTHYLYDAQITAHRDCADTINLIVTTKELWTLTPEINFSRSGGENKSRFGFRDTNLFGTGKRISISKRSDKDRSGYTFIYDDPSVFGSRYQSRFEIADNDDGERHYFDFTLPFYSLGATTSYGVVSFNDERESSLYERGEVVSEFKQKTRINQLFYGQGTHQKGWTKRWLFGVQHETHQFEQIAQTTLPIAQDRELLYPWLSYQWLEDAYITLANFDSIGRTEDLNLGWHLFTRLGYSDDQLSDDASRFVYEASINKAWQPSDDQLWRFYSSIEGYWNNTHHSTENLLFDTRLRIHKTEHNAQAWFLNSQISFANNLTEDKQMTLGGDSGLRGYPIQYQTGDRRFLVNLEKRYYWEYHWLQLFKVGGAAFFDIGRAWRHNKNNGNNGGVLKNVGLGLRLAPSRATAKTVIHLDFAIPLDKSDDVDSVQWLVTVKNTF